MKKSPVYQISKFLYLNSEHHSFFPYKKYISFFPISTYPHSFHCDLYSNLGDSAMSCNRSSPTYHCLAARWSPHQTAQQPSVHSSARWKPTHHMYVNVRSPHSSLRQSFPAAMMEDQSTFTCTATNNYGAQSKSTAVRITGLGRKCVLFLNITVPNLSGSCAWPRSSWRAAHRRKGSSSLLHRCSWK